MLYALVKNQVLPIKTIVRILIYGALFQIILMIGQLKLNGSIGLGILGEQLIGSDILNVAKIDLADGTKQIRPYGTFLHPNILALYLSVVFFLVFDFLHHKKKWLWVLVIGVGIYLTQSLAAFVAAAGTLATWGLLNMGDKKHHIRRKVGLIVVLFLVVVNAWFFLNSRLVNAQDPSFTERLEQNTISSEMFSANPLGVGVRNFTLTMEQFTDVKLKPWEFQPVHNTYFLVMSEVGIQGLLLFLAFMVFLFYRVWEGGKALGVFHLLLIAPFDHFLWDSWVGLMILGLIAGIFSLNNAGHVKGESVVH